VVWLVVWSNYLVLVEMAIAVAVEGWIIRLMFLFGGFDGLEFGLGGYSGFGGGGYFGVHCGGLGASLAGQLTWSLQELHRSYFFLLWHSYGWWPSLCVAHIIDDKTLR
jgi:hypothetical protein